MPTLTMLENYRDDLDNIVVYNGVPHENVRITFAGRNNRLTVSPTAKLGRLTVDFNCSNGVVEIGGNSGVPALSAGIRVGEDSAVLIGENVSTTSICGFSATEGTTISVGDDVMFASQNQVRADDGHPIFDVRTGARVNVSKDIKIGDHVWLSWGVVVLGGTSIGSGAVIGYGSLVTRGIPNNCVAVGSPAVPVRKHVAWERPHLSLTKPFYKPDATTVKRSKYWALTAETQRNSLWARMFKRLAR